jgi:hypothetical protein
MARAQSYNWEIEIGGSPIYPLSISEFSEGEEGRIEVADGSRKYKIRDNIFTVDEVEVKILLKNDRIEYDVLQEFVKSGKAKDVFITGRDATGTGRFTYLFSNCECTYGKKSGFDRKGKAEETKSYFLIPEDIVEVS